jgi:hypothetical protein
MAFCAASTFPPITTDSQANLPYTGSILSNGARDNAGLLTDDALESIYKNLANSGKIVSLEIYNANINNDITKGTRETSKVMLDNLGKKEDNFMNAVKSEYCYYYTRYKYSLNMLFQSIVSTSTGVQITDAKKTEIQGKLDAAKSFNQKLNDLVQITNKIAKKRADEMATINGASNTDGINALNVSITNTFNQLRSNNEVLKKEDAVAELRKRMTEFSQEKNLSANNLLALYGFLNLVSIGLLFYIYRK